MLTLLHADDKDQRTLTLHSEKLAFVCRGKVRWKTGQLFCDRHLE